MSQKLQKGASTAINHSLHLEPTDRLVIITDFESIKLGDALENQAQNVTSDVLKIRIEDFGERPLMELPEKMISQIKEFNPNVSIYCAQGAEGEITNFRSPLIKFLTQELNCRHGHMIGITEDIFESALNQDYDVVFKVTHNVHDLVTQYNKIIVTDPHGTRIQFDIDNINRNWKLGDGIIPEGGWTNIPAGELFTAPVNVNGQIVGWILGDYFSEKYGPLASPLIFKIVDGYCVEISTKDDADENTLNAKSDLEKYFETHEYSKRVGELGIGTLVGLEDFIGNLLQDEKFPGVHMAFGDPYGSDTGADWECTTHVDTIAKDVSIVLATEEDQKIIMKNGTFINEILN